MTRVIAVTSAADDGPHTLRDAVAKANAETTRDVRITFRLPASAITLTTGQLELSNTAVPIAIVGPGADQLAIDGNGASRVFEIDPGVSASISKLTVTAGLSGDAGAGLLNQGTLTLTDVTVSHCTTTNLDSIVPAGAGLDNAGTATLVGCTFADNAGSQGGGVTNVGTATLRDCTFVDNTATYYGGGMENYAVATLDGCSFVGNSCFGGDGGGFVGIYLGNVPWTSSVLTGCTFTDNSAPGFGGGLALDGPLNGEVSGPLQVADCIFRGNLAGSGGGLFLRASNPTTATVTGCLIEGNSAYFDGGGIGVDDFGVTLANSVIRNNSSGSYGGGVSNGGTLTMTGVTVSGNSTGKYGGGISSDATLTMTGVTVSGNSAGAQGGGLNLAGKVSLTNCTVSGNTASQGGGFVAYREADVDLVACTISGNTATAPGGGGGLYNYPYGGSDPKVTLTNTIVAGNEASDGPSDIAGADAGLVTGSYNLIGTGGSGGLSASDHNLLDVADPGLTPLGDYGGPTPTIALQPDSPARHQGTAVAGVTTDQRGFPLDHPADIGAFQLQDGPLVVDIAIDGLGSPSGRLSLRQAINLADVLDGGATINFDKHAFARKSVVTLTEGPLDLSNVTGPITIVGPGLGKLVVNGGGTSRVFQVDAGVAAFLSGLTITGGVSAGDGGGLLNLGTVALSGVSVVGNSAANGGGIANAGTAVILSSSIDGNIASASGGGIFNTGTLILNRADLSANVAGTFGGGLYNRGTVLLVYGTVNDNAASSGGGIYADDSGQPVILIGTEVKRNKGGNIVGRTIQF